MMLENPRNRKTRILPLGVFSSIIDAFDWIEGDGARQHPEAELVLRAPGNTGATFVVIDRREEDELLAATEVPTGGVNEDDDFSVRRSEMEDQVVVPNPPSVGVRREPGEVPMAPGMAAVRQTIGELLGDVAARVEELDGTDREGGSERAPTVDEGEWDA